MYVEPAKGNAPEAGAPESKAYPELVRVVMEELKSSGLLHWNEHSSAVHGLACDILERTSILGKSGKIPMTGAGQVGAEIIVTPQMVEAGKNVLIESGILPLGGELGCEGGIAAAIYRAMRSLENPS